MIFFSIRLNYQLSVKQLNLPSFLETTLSILQRVWQYDSFREGQEEIIDHLLSGKDTLAVMPTGGGKSLCYQIPAMVQPGCCVVVTPLIALMKDQVQALEKRGVQAVAIYGGLTRAALSEAYNHIRSGHIKFVYVSPERLRSIDFQDQLVTWDINFLAVDEAHCISQWGYDFRPAYLHIAAIRPMLPNVPVIALTASATQAVRQDILEKLEMKDAKLFLHSFERKNISFSVNKAPVKLNRLTDILTKISGSTLVYCNNRKRTQEISETLNALGFQANFYHAGLSMTEKEKRQQDWLSNQFQIMVCTNAFGMGIDKADVRLVVHFDIPDAPESFYQEAGRAGRDGNRSWHVLLYHDRDLENLKQSSALKYPDQQRIREIYKALCSYLSIPLGFGEQQAFDFQLGEFAQRFGFPIFEVLGTLKILEQHELIYLTDGFYKPSKAEVLANREAIRQLENDYPKLAEVLQGLLRTYPGIFQSEMPIDEWQLAQHIEASWDYVTLLLQQLRQLEYISYFEKNNQAQIIFLHDRIPENLLRINLPLLKMLKQRHETRILFMISLCQNHTRCRSRYLISYFEEHLEQDCGICDLCLLKNKKSKVEKFEHYKTVILQAIKEQNGIQIDQFCTQFSSQHKDDVLRTIRILMDEQLILLDKNGRAIRYE